MSRKCLLLPTNSLIVSTRTAATVSEHPQAGYRVLKQKVCQRGCKPTKRMLFAMTPSLGQHLRKLYPQGPASMILSSIRKEEQLPVRNFEVVRFHSAR